MKAWNGARCLLAACIPQAGRGRFDGLPVRKRQGLVPDLLMKLDWPGARRPLDQLLELKTLHHGSTTYPSGASARCSAVTARAAALPSEYCSKARRVDRQYCNTPPGQIGPVQARLQTFPAVRGLVFGAWGEASPDAHQLVACLAKQGAARLSQGSEKEQMHGFLGWHLKRRWAVAAVREAARLPLARLEYVGHGAAAAAERRRAAAARMPARHALDLQAAMQRPRAGRRLF